MGRLVSNYQAVTTPHRSCGRCNGRNLKCLLFSLHCSGQEEIRPRQERKFVDSALALGHRTVSGCKETKCLLILHWLSGPRSVSGCKETKCLLILHWRSGPRSVPDCKETKCLLILYWRSGPRSVPGLRKQSVC